MRRTSQSFAHALRLSLAGVLAGGAAHAQDQDEDSAELDRLTVTGSRIKRTEIEGPSPVFVIQREDIERTGLTSVGDLLQDLPIAGSGLNTQFNNGGNGETRLDLRNLGANRVLILLNGRRVVTNLGGFVDLNNIPVAAIKRIEVLKDGASAIYGSDAIAGVVNIITRDDYQGVQANAYIGQFDDNDGETQAYDFTVGSTSDRGSLFFSASYVKSESVLAGDRAISAEPQFGTGNAFGSSGTPQGRFGAAVLGSFGLTTDPGANVTGPGGLGAGAFRQGDYSAGSPGDGSDRFNFAPDNYLITPQERTNIFTVGQYELTDDLRLSIEASYNNRESDTLLAPTPLFLGLFGANLAGSVGVGANNPFNPFGVPLNPSSWLLGRRLIEAGPRNFQYEVDSYRFGAGVNGSLVAFDRYFDWEVNYVYGEIQRNRIATGEINVQRVAEALSDACVTTPGCVPLDVFGGIPGNTNPRAGDPGSITREMLDFILFTSQDSGRSESIQYSANITGELFELPGGPLAFAAGYEYRHDSGFDSPDALITAGITSGNSRQPTEGAVTVDEVFLELGVPILSGLPGAERLDLSVATRYSDYDTFGDTVTSEVGIQWQPIDDLLLRASYSEGFRAPSIFELFGGQSDNFPALSDPCSDFLGIQNPGSVQTPTIIANCVSQGVPSDGSYVQANSQIRTTVGSNPNLQPETSESVTFGFVYSPSWLDGLDLTVDYYEIDVDNAVSSVGAQTILNSCANTLQLCSLITRGSIGQVTNILDSGINVNSQAVGGFDLVLSYTLPSTRWGTFRVVFDAAYQGTNKQSTPDLDNPDPEAPAVEQEFVGFNFGDVAVARIRSSMDINWSYGDWEATWGMQHFDNQGEVCGVPAAFGFCNLDTDADGVPDARTIGTTVYHDVQLSYHLSQYDTRVTAGVQNIGDKGPPLSTQAFANSFNVADYRSPGRFPYVRVTVDF